MKLLLEERRSVMDVAGTWLPRIVVAMLFTFVGKSKFADHSEWIAIFAKIGFGQWFRYFTGIVQIVGGVLVLIYKDIPFRHSPYRMPDGRRDGCMDILSWPT